MDLLYLIQVLSGQSKLFIQVPDIYCPCLVKASGFKSEASRIARLFDKLEKAFEIYMSLAQRQDLQIAPVLVSSVIIIDMIVLDMAFFPEPVILRLIQQLQLAVKICHLGVEYKPDIRILLI